MKKYILIACVLLQISTHLSAQQTDNSVVATQQAAKDKSGTTKDILTNFYQLSLQGIFGGSQSFSFTSTVFGVLDSVNKKIEIDTLFSKYRWARNIQFTIGGGIDTNYRINHFNAGLTVALINKRDVTNHTKLFDNLNTIEDSLNKYIGRAKRRIQQNITSFLNTNAGAVTISDSISHKNDIIMKSIKRYRTTHNLSDLDQDFVSALQITGGYTIYIQNLNADDSLFKRDVRRIERRPLWTIGGEYLRHTATNTLDTITAKTDFVVGVGNIDKKLWEVTANGYAKRFKPDTSTNALWLFHGEVGINKVLVQNEIGQSRMELKVFGSYDKTKKITGDNNTFAANVTFRICVLNDFWLPITMKYDPKTGNFFGFLSLNLNIDQYRNLL